MTRQVMRNMKTEDTGEFLGDFAGCADTERDTFFFEPNSFALYRLNKMSLKVELVVDLFELYGIYSYFPILVRYRENIIIIPKMLNKDWIVYNIQNEKCGKIKSPIEMEYEYSEAIIQSEFLYLLPGKTKYPIIVVNLKENQVIEIKNIGDVGLVTDHERNRINNGIECWGWSGDGENLFCPINGTNYAYFGKEGIKEFEFTVNIIFADSDGVWIVSDEEKRLFKCDRDGTISWKKEIPYQSIEGHFCKMAACGDYVYIFSDDDSTIVACNKNSQKILLIKAERDELFRPFIARNIPVPYWYSGIFDERIMIFPHRYRMRIIKEEKKIFEERKLILGSSITSEEFFERIKKVNKQKGNWMFQESETYSLQKYIEHITIITEE